MAKRLRECGYERTAIQCRKLVADFPGSHWWMAFQLPVNRQVGSLRITLLRSKLHQMETGII